MAQEWAEEKGISYRESEQMVDSELFLDEYPMWGLGTPHQSVVLHEMFLHAAGMRAERGRMHVPLKATRAVYPNLNLGQTYLPWN